MRSTTWPAAAFALALGASGASAMAVYGRDNRKDVHELPAGLRALSRSVAALFLDDKVAVDGETAALTAAPLLEKLPLSPRARFATQPAGAHCTGALVAPDIVLTAGHCVTRAIPCESTRVVFDFARRDAEADPTVVPASSVYRCAAVLGAEDANGRDWALLRLDRAVADRAPLPISASPAMAPGEAVFTIGHPLGLPAKYAGAAAVRSAGEASFSTDIDAFGGNSGGPVFRTATREIVGVVSAGDSWLRPDPKRPGLLQVVVLPHDWGTGTVVSGAGIFSPALRARLRRDLLGDAEVARLRRRLESLALDLP